MIHRILTKVFDCPWLIKPDVHFAIQRAVINKVNGIKVELPSSDVEKEREVSFDTLPSIAVIPVFGVLGKHLSNLEIECGGIDVNTIASALKKIRVDETVKAIVLYVNSPGGTVTGIPELGALIAEIDKTKPVYAFTDGACCSGAYWLASQCRAILTSPSADLGSIGVYMALLDESRALEMQGVKVNAIYKGNFKLSGASFKPLTDEERQMFQAGIDKIYNAFVAAVNVKRTISIDNCQGQCFDGEEAVQKGLADGLCNDLDEAISLINP